MKIVYLTFIATTAACWTQSLGAQVRPLGVCEALNSAADHQRVLIHAAMGSTQHMTFLYEGTGTDPCPGWRKYLFTAPSTIPLVTTSYSGIHVPSGLFYDYIQFAKRLRDLHRGNPSAQSMVTISGVLIRPRWPLIFMSARGEYFGWGEGLNGGYASILVVTSAPIEDR